ncbi:MAG: hypothetical protein R6X10_03060 [Desulfobacterales bacterium]
MKIDPIKLDLSAHCIETETKRAYNRLLSTYFKEKNGRAAIEKKIEILKYFLEKLDFQKLRSTYPELAGGSSSQVVILTDQKEGPVIQIDGKSVYPLFIRKKHSGKDQTR